PYPASLPLTVISGDPSKVTYNSSTGALNMSSGVQVKLTAGNYCLGAITIQNNNTSLQVDGHTTITANGVVQIKSGAVINNTTADPVNFQLTSTYGNDTGENTNPGVLLDAGGTTMYMTVYAPTANLKFQGGGTLYGAIAA